MGIAMPPSRPRSAFAPCRGQRRWPRRFLRDCCWQVLGELPGPAQCLTVNLRPAG